MAEEFTNPPPYSRLCDDIPASSRNRTIMPSLNSYTQNPTKVDPPTDQQPDLQSPPLALGILQVDSGPPEQANIVLGWQTPTVVFVQSRPHNTNFACAFALSVTSFLLCHLFGLIAFSFASEFSHYFILNYVYNFPLFSWGMNNLLIRLFDTTNKYVITQKMR